MTQTLSTDIQKILEIARHSPSGHNTQPWKVVTHQTTVTIGYDNTRHLTVGDPDKRELFISLGCFVESVVIVAAELGYEVSIRKNGDNPQKVVSLKIDRANIVNPYKSSSIIKRTSDRRLYQPKALDAALLERLNHIREGTARLNLLTSPEAISFLAQKTYDATYRTMSDPAFRTELASWVRNNWTKKHDGMPAYTQGIPGPVSLLAKVIISKNKGVAKDQAKKDARRVVRSSAICLITTSEHNVSAWLDAGRLYQRLCIEAVQSDVRTSGVSAAVIDSTTNKAIMRHLKLKATPVALLRLGYTKNLAKKSPRLPLSRFVSEA